LKCGRGRERSATWSWWRRSRFSITRSWRSRKRAAKVGRRMRNRSSIPGASPIVPDGVLPSYNLVQMELAKQLLVLK
jgi:hypothetical protein